MTGVFADILAWVLLLGGGFFIFVGGVGILRMPDFYTRVHAASLTDTLGAILVIAGLCVQSGITLVTVKLVLILVFLLFTSPTASYALANAATLAGLKPKLADDNDGGGDGNA